MLRGRSSHTLDDKGRIIIPARFRSIIQSEGGDMVVLTQRENYIYGYSMQEWNKFETEVRSMANMSDSFQRFLRFVVGSAQECPIDKQGRVLIPQTLRDEAGLEREVELVGVLTHFEIWSKDNWAEEKDLLKKDLQKVEVRNEIAKLGL
jgi:MraZ protein